MKEKHGSPKEIAKHAVAEEVLEISMGRIFAPHCIITVVLLYKRFVKLASVYAALALGLLTFTALLVRTLYRRTHKPGSGDVKL